MDAEPCFTPVSKVTSPGTPSAGGVVAATDDLLNALGMTNNLLHSDENDNDEQAEDANLYNVVPNPDADKADLSNIRGAVCSAIASGGGASNNNDNNDLDDQDNNSKNADLENLAELVPDVKARRQSGPRDHSRNIDDSTANDDMMENIEMNENGAEVTHRKMSMMSGISTDAKKFTKHATNKRPEIIQRIDSMNVEPGKGTAASAAIQTSNLLQLRGLQSVGEKKVKARSSSSSSRSGRNEDTSYDDDGAGSDHALDDEAPIDSEKVGKEFSSNNMGSSAASMSTATQTHEVRMPMYLPTFKPATGCTNASDFIVRCFVARLRAGITVVKHGRSRWCKSRLRVLHIHPDGRSLSRKPAEGEPTSSRRPPKLDLSTCLEVRHAWSPDPQNPMYTGSPILRQKCEAANAHKSFALIFKQRTVDITAVTADQCKVLMEGFSALCFRLQVATLAAARSPNATTGRQQHQQHARPMPEEDGVSTTVSNTLTNTSTPKGTHSGGGAAAALAVAR